MNTEIKKMTPENEFDYNLKTILGIAIGEASMKWIPRPTGNFDSSGAEDVLNRLFLDIKKLLDKTLS